jgi:hypothetical protein
MGIGVRIETNLTLVDTLFNWKAPLLPVAGVVRSYSSKYPFLSGIFGVAMVEPSPLIVSGSNASAIGFSSPASFIASRSDLASNSVFLSLFPNLATTRLKALETGSFPLMAAQRIGNGTVIVTGDAQMFTNPVATEANNQELIRNLLSNSTVYIDSSHWQPNTAAVFKGEIALVYAQISQFPLNYFFTLGVVEVALVIVPLYNDARRAPQRKMRTTKRKEEKRFFELEQLEEADSSLSTYNKENLDRVKKDRERYGVR